jgi:N-acetylneuraminic acid mutarotase
MIFTANPVLVATSVFAYRPSTQQWRSINAAGLPKFTSAIWSGKEVYCANAKQGNLLAQIYAYNPVTDKWRAISNGPVTAQTNPLIFAWVGGRYVVYEPRRQMLSYNPLADQ